MLKLLPFSLLLSAVILPVDAAQPQLEICGHRANTSDKSCIVDGDTLWLEGENIRLKDFDTPEPYTNVGGGQAEKELAAEASARLLQLLNDDDWTIERFGHENGGRGNRRLATIRIDGRDVGHILIAERLARRWPDGEEWWCCPRTTYLKSEANGTAGPIRQGNLRQSSR